VLTSGYRSEVWIQSHAFYLCRIFVFIAFIEKSHDTFLSILNLIIIMDRFNFRNEIFHLFKVEFS